MLNDHTHTHSVYSDTPSIGFGALFNLDWLAGYFNRSELPRSVTHRMAISPTLCDSAHINAHEMWASTTSVDR